MTKAAGQRKRKRRDDIIELPVRFVYATGPAEPEPAARRKKKPVIRPQRIPAVYCPGAPKYDGFFGSAEQLI